jgi:hypothetical protein
MATTFHQIQYWNLDIAPGNSRRLRYGPAVKYGRGTVQVTCCPFTWEPGVSPTAPAQFRTQTLYVPEVYITSIPFSETSMAAHTYAEFNIVNGGQHAIRAFSVTITVIGP